MRRTSAGVLQTMTTRGWVIPADAGKPLYQSALFDFKKENECEVQFVVRDCDRFHCIIFFDDRGRVKDLEKNTRVPKRLVDFDILGDVFIVAEDSMGERALSEEEVANLLKF